MDKTIRTQVDRLAAVDEVLPEILAGASAYDEAAEFPAAAFDALRRKGLLALTVPHDLGGDQLWWDGNFSDYYEILSKIAAVDSSVSQLLQVHSHALGMLAWHATPRQKELYLSEIVSRGLLVASVGSEAKVGSTSPEEYASELTETPSGWRLTCDKYFASLAPGADYYMIWVALPGAGKYSDRQVWVLVPREAAEVKLVNTWDTLGMRATVSWGIKIEDYLLPEESIIGAPGSWVNNDPRSFTLAYVANHLGSAQGAYDFVCDWVRERPYLRNSETVRAAVGGMGSDLFGVRSALDVATRIWEQAGNGGWKDEELSALAEHMSLRALHVAKHVALAVVQKAFDICGARATFRDCPLERTYRDIRTMTLHFRDDLYMARIADEILDGQYGGKAQSGGLALVLPTHASQPVPQA